MNVLEDPIIDAQPIVSQELCQNATPDDLTVTVSGGTSSPKTYQWYQNTTNSNSGGTQITGEISDTLIPNTANVGTFYYYVMISQPEADCAITSNVSTLIIKPAPIFTKQPVASEICLDGTATELEVAYLNGTGTASYQWYSNSVDDTSTGTEITGEIGATYIPTTNTIGTTYYYAIISFTSGGCTEIISDTASVIVNQQLTVTSVTTPQYICAGGTADKMKVTYSGGAGIDTYQWYSNTTNSNTGGSAITGEINSEYTPVSFSTDGIFYYYVEVSLDGNGCSLAKSDVFIVNVLKDPIIDAQPIASQELCQNATPDDLTVTVSGGTSSPKTYQWYVNTDSATDGSSVVPGATSATYTPPTDTVGSLFYYVVVTQAESGCSVESEVSVIKINEAPEFKKQPISSEICLDGTATLLEVTYQNGTGTASYQWYSNSVDDTSTGTQIPGETNATYNPPTNTIGTTYYYAIISFTSGGCTEIISDTASVIVVEQLTIAPVSNPQTVCIGGTADKLSITYSGGTGNATYQWYSNTTNSNTGGSAITGEINSEYTPVSFSTDGIFYYYVEVSLDGNGCSLAKSDVFIVNVLEDPIIDAQPIVSQELCQNATPVDLTVTVSGGTSSPKTYQWYQNTTNSNSGGTQITGEISDTLIPNTANVGTFYYYVMISQPEADCAITSNVSTLIIKPAPIFTKQPVASEICLDGTATELEVAYLNGTGTASYQWYSNSVDDTSTGTEITGEIGATYIPTTNTVGTTYYYAVISFTSGGCTEIISDTASVIVNQIPVINFAEITTYSKVTFNFDPKTDLGNTVPIGTKYIWATPTFNPAGAIIGATEQTIPQDEISQTLENTGNTPIIVTYTITPATATCVGDDFILEVTVNPNIKSNAIVTNISCFEENDGSISTNIVGGILLKQGALT